MVPSQPSGPLDEIVARLCTRLGEGLADATRARADELIDAFYAAMRGELGSGSFRRHMRRADRQRNRLLTDLTKQFLREIEKLTRAHVRETVRNERKARAQAARAAAAAARAEAGAATVGQRHPRRRPVRPPPPPLDPEQLKRDAETQRLRALLRPVTEELPALPPPPPTVTPVPVAVTPTPTTPGGFLRALEKEIQDAVPNLGKLSPERCGAQIAAWAAQVRQFRDQLMPDAFSAMRPAIRIFLEHLTELRAAMEASFVDALDPQWHPPSWPDYIEANRARAEGRPARLTQDRLFAYHHAMLRALVLPHRKNVRDQAQLVIDAAAEVLPPDDGLLRSARRRHAERGNRHTGEWTAVDGQQRPWQETTTATEPSADALPPAGAPAAAEPVAPAGADNADFGAAFAASDGQALATSSDEEPDDEAGATTSETGPAAEPDESEFEKLWKK